MTESKDLPPQEFLLQSRGTLPEFITEADLETLNSGLRFLFAHLRDARQQFENEADGGRFAAVTKRNPKGTVTPPSSLHSRAADEIRAATRFVLGKL
jgi:hypothetical protein